MKKTGKRRAIAGMAMVVLIIGLHRRAAAQAGDDAAANSGAAQVATQNGATVVRLSAAAQASAGIRTAGLRTARAQARVSAAATVLGAQSLVAARAQYLAGETALAQAETAAAVAEQEYRRLEGLNRNQQNASAKQVEAALGTWQADEAQVSGDRQALAMQIAAATQSWGPAPAQWIATGGAMIDAVMHRSRVLLAVTLPAGAGAPATIIVQGPGPATAAHRIAEYPEADPRVQGMNELYWAPAAPGLAQGANLSAELPRGRARSGVLVPTAAVLWWNGAEWAYVRTSPTTFVRRPVGGAQMRDGGMVVTSGFKLGERVVVQGAETLLSAELQGQIQPED